MRLIKMEENIPERAKDQSSSYNSMKEAEANALRDHNVGRETVKANIESEELIPPPYINVQRVPDVNTTKNFLTNTPLLSGNELLVDINGDLISSGSISLERYIPHQYEDDLLHEDLTEDDKRLAAALVAVQLVNQQKQQSSTHILPMLTPAQIPVGSKLVSVNDHISLIPPLSGTNKMATPENETITVNSSVITSDKNSEMSNNYDQIKKEEHRAHLESLGLHTETEEIEISTEEIEIGTNEVIKTELSDFIIQEANIKTEVCDSSEPLALSDEEQESDDVLHDSDYENGDDKSRNSLPHKKRIPRKLKQPRKTSQSWTVVDSRFKCSKCSEYFPNASAFTAHKATHFVKRPFQSGVTQTTSSSFSCELCFKNFTNQWKFFEHLKYHYEPIELDSSSTRRGGTTTAAAAAVGGAAGTATAATAAGASGKSQTTSQAEGGQKNCLKTQTVKVRGTQVGAQQNQTPKVKTPKTEPNNQIITQNSLNKWSSPSQLQDVTITATTQTSSSSSSSSILHQQLTQTQPEQILWECEPCKRIFRRQKTFETHMSVAHPKQEEIEEFSEPEDMMEGIRVEVHSDDDKETVEKDGAIQKEWYREEDLHAAEADIREMEARTKTVYIDAHMCEMCNEAYETKALLNQHISQQHADIMTAITKTVRRQPNGAAKKGNLNCKQCGRMFHHRNSLMYHLKSHLGERPHQCEVCGKGFFATSALKVHMRQHSGVKPFKCEFCGRNFRQWGDLKYHCISIHSDQKNFQCEYCGKDFARKYSLTVHSRIHTGERNYKCEFCEKSFRASSYLQNHRRIHTGEKPHPCDVCGKPFRVRSDMKRHMITHSKEPYSTYMVKTKRQTGTPSSNNGDSKLIVQVDEQISEISKVEELEVSTVESILPDETVSASNRLQEELTVTYAQRDPLESVTKESNTLYVWPVYMT